jgi:hypothetical protein
MLELKAARLPCRRKGPARIGLAVAGGGPIGGMYELGALRALDEAVDGLDLCALDSGRTAATANLGSALDKLGDALASKKPRRKPAARKRKAASPSRSAAAV